MIHPQEQTHIDTNRFTSQFLSYHNSTVYSVLSYHRKFQWYVKTIDLINPSRTLLSSLPTLNVKSTVSQIILSEHIPIG